MYNLLTNLSKEYRSVEFGEAALYALLGFAIVFVGIAFLILVVWAVGKLMNKTQGEAEEKTDILPVEKKQTQSVETELSDETIAVITAAIAAYYRQTNPKCEFTVKRIKRI